MHARVFVGTRHTSALCYLCVCSPCPSPWLFVCSNQRNQKGGCAVRAVVSVAPRFLFSPSRLVARAGRLATWHDMVTYLRSWWRCVACLLFVCMRRHTFCPLSLPFASYISGHAGGRWARLGYASWSPFTFVGVVPVLVSCPLRSVAWHATYLDPTSHVFFFCVLFFTSVVFFIPPCLSLHTILLVRGGNGLAAFRACACEHTFLSLCERGCA